MKKKITIYWLIAIIVVFVIIAIVAINPKEEIIPGEETEEGAILEKISLEKAAALLEELEGKIVFDTIAEIKVSADGFEPADFYVTTADVIKVSVTSDKQPCLLKFKHADLQGVIIDVAEDGKGEEIFGKPLVGEYIFYCEGSELTLTGLMHVRYKSEE